MNDSRQNGMAHDLTGRQIGRYLLQRQIGSGGVATVYQAYDQVDGRSVALKVLQPRADSNTISRFRREAFTAGKLRHENIVRIYQVGTALESDVAYIAMELIEGENLADWVTRAGRLRPEESCNLLEPIARALAFAHEQGVVHRDVKPSNILLQPASPGASGSVQLESLDHPVVPLLTDFGVARALDEPELTGVGRTVGTPAYMAPEQASGSRTIDGRADIYALGAVLYRTVVGHLPFSGTATQILHAHVYAPLTIDDDILRQLPPIVVEIMRRSLAKKPEDRYQDAGALAKKLAVAAGRPLAIPAVYPGQAADATATLTLSAMPATSPTPLPRSTSILVPASEPISDGVMQGKTALQDTAPQPALPESRSRLQRLEHFNWIGYGLAVLGAMIIVIGGTLLAANLLYRPGTESAGQGSPPSLDSGKPPAQGDNPGADGSAALALAAPSATPTSLPPNQPTPTNTTLPSPAVQGASPPPVASPLPDSTLDTTATATPVPIATPAPQPTATPLPTVAATATEPPQDVISTCPNIVDPVFYDAISAMDGGSVNGFGCPTGAPIRAPAQLLYFELGFMLSLANDPSVYIFYDETSQWERAVSTWQTGDPPKTGEYEPPTPDIYQPEGPFGQLWADPQRRLTLGHAVTDQPTTFAAVEQIFPGGALVGDEISGQVWPFFRESLRL